jgi:hypothetical protein
MLTRGNIPCGFHHPAGLPSPCRSIGPSILRTSTTVRQSRRCEIFSGPLPSGQLMSTMGQKRTYRSPLDVCFTPERVATHSCMFRSWVCHIQLANLVMSIAPMCGLKHRTWSRAVQYFWLKLYSVMTHLYPGRCGKWPGPATTGSGCAHGTPVRRKINPSAACLRLEASSRKVREGGAYH